MTIIHIFKALVVSIAFLVSKCVVAVAILGSTGWNGANAQTIAQTKSIKNDNDIHQPSVYKSKCVPYKQAHFCIK